jgi:hypothetical protein
MGLRGPKPRPRLRDKEVWRCYLTLKALGYWPEVHGRGSALRAEVARRLGLTTERVSAVLETTEPKGCFK